MIQKTDLFWSVIVLVVPIAMSALNAVARSALPDMHLETGEYVADDCGKCDHTASCGYHYPPRQYFHDHPKLSCKKDYQTEYVNGKPLLGLGNRHQWADEARNREMLSRKNRLLVQPQDRRQTEFFSPEWVQKAMLRPSAFSMWLEGLNVGGDARQVLADYCVGGTARDVVVQG